MRIRASRPGTLAARLALILATATGAGTGFAGRAFVAVEEAPHTLVIEGSSNVGGWTAEGVVIRGQVTLDVATEDATESLLDRLFAAAPAVAVSIPVTSLHGSGGRGMDRVMHSALKADRQPDIAFALTALERANDSDGRPTAMVAGRPVAGFRASGTLAVAGVSRAITLTGTLSEVRDGLKVEGQADLRMSDFGIDPPRALLGALRTRDEVVVRFTWMLMAQGQE